MASMSAWSSSEGRLARAQLRATKRSSVGRVGGAEGRARTASAVSKSGECRAVIDAHASRATASVWVTSEARERGAVAEAGPGARHNARLCVGGQDQEDLRRIIVALCERGPCSARELR